MKKIFPFLIVFSLLLLSSCSKDNNDEIEPEPEPVPQDYYYVHYVFPAYGSSIKYRDAENNLKNGPTAGSPFGTNHGGLDTIIGPVQKGFVAHLSGYNGVNVLYKPTMSISVAKNSTIFELKASYTFTKNIGAEIGTIEYEVGKEEK